MSLLFENLQTMNEASKLEERNSLSVSEYNKIKIALNKHNSMKGNFILHPGEISCTDYKLRMSVHGAFKNKEHDRDSYHAYNSDYKNDEVTKGGVGVCLYIVYVNLIDETIRFVNNSYRLADYVKQYEKYLIDNGTLSNGEMDIKSLVESIEKTIEISKTDLENVLHSKNFIYNLTGKRKVEPTNSPNYNLNLEQAKLTEDFDSSMPNWLMRAIKMHNNSRNSSHKDLNYNMSFDTMKWTVEPFPEKGKLVDIGNNEYIALLIDASGDEHKGDYIVYFPAAFIGNNETITINDRNRRIDSMSLRALAPYVKEFAHTVGGEQSRANVRQKQQDRVVSKNGSVDRTQDDDKWMYGYSNKWDKSGYIVDPNKYKRLLAQIKHSEYVDRLNDLFVVLTDVRTKLKEFMSSDDAIPIPGKKDYSRDRNFNKGTRAYKEYSSALACYGDALATLDKIKEGKKDYGTESFESFTRSIKDAETYIVNCLNILENN